MNKKYQYLDKVNFPSDIRNLKVSELKAIAQAKGLQNYKRLKKTPLIALLKQHQ